jgi:hypothetical protein
MYGTPEVLVHEGGVRSLSDHHVPQHAPNDLFLLINAGVTINRNCSVILLTVHFPAIAPGTPP